MMPTTIRGKIRAGVLAGAVTAGLAAAALAAGTRAEGPGAEGTATPTVTQSVTATPTPFIPEPTPTPWAPPPPLPRPAGPPAHDWAGFGPVDAEPVRVHTGDGDCLNLRWLPGTAGQPTPRACAPEGTLLWLSGAAVEADGETWRYALGMGWVAVRYTVPAPEAPRGFGPFRAATVLGTDDGSWTQAAEVTPDGRVQVRGGGWLPFNAAWAAVRPSPLAPSGRYIAFQDHFAEPAGGKVADLATGGRVPLGKAMPLLWGPGDRLAVRLPDACDACPGAIGWTAPPFDEVTPVPAAVAWNLAWLPDGSGFVTWSAELGLRVVGLDGSERAIPLALGSDEWPGELSVSPSGRRVLAVPFAGPVRVIDLQTGEVRRIERPQPAIVGGRCGGTPGLTSAWIDDETIAWHEEGLGRERNGIWVVNLRTGSSQVYPFTDVLEMRPAGGGLLAFTVQGYAPKEGLGPVSWLLDPGRGLAWPATGGMFAAWR